ncbi:MAG TPA: hypothetical protein VHW66_24210 [Stellaceae bacterium]|jgi:hypothetical protein|nr:hypothetical protein [Stellaceae bacterium]
MSRVGTLFWLALAMTSCVIMFMINYAVQSLQGDLTKVHQQTIAAQLEIRVLHAEWSYLTQPERLAELNKQFLSLTPIATRQLQQTITEIPLRTMPDPAVEKTASAAPAPAPAAGLELPAASPAGRGLDALFAQASAEPQAAGGALPATPIALSAAAARPAPADRGLDALFMQIATGR